MKKLILFSVGLICLSGCVEQSTNVNQRNISTDLVTASAEGDLDAFNDLISKGADINKADKEGCTPLLGALFNDRAKIAKLLIEKGADVNKYCKDGSGDSTNPLITATIHRMYDIVKLLLEKGAKINEVDGRGATALFYAVGTGNIEIAKLLIKHRADVNKSENDGLSPLHSVAHSGNVEIAKLLLKNGADVNQKDKEGFTPLMEAKQQN